MFRTGRVRIIIFGLLALPFLLGGCSDGPQTAVNPDVRLTEDDITVGMSLSDFRRVFAEVRPDQSGRWELPATLYGLKGRWTYTFAGDSLSWYVFNAYVEDVSESPFERSLDATKQLVSRYTASLGSPQRVASNMPTFRDPAVAPHAGYSVLQAIWSTRQEKLTVEFYFMGPSERYTFLVTVQAHA